MFISKAFGVEYDGGVGVGAAEEHGEETGYDSGGGGAELEGGGAGGHS